MSMELAGILLRRCKLLYFDIKRRNGIRIVVTDVINRYDVRIR